MFFFPSKSQKELCGEKGRGKESPGLPFVKPLPLFIYFVSF